MIVRTYKRRSRADLLGSQGSAGEDDDELGLVVPRTFSSAGRFSQDDSLEEPNSPLWNSLQHDRNCFSLPSSQGSSGIDNDDLLQFSSLPSHRPEPVQQELDKGPRTLPSNSADSFNGKFKRSVSAGQKLIRAESLLKKAKTSSSINVKSKELGSSRSVCHAKSACGDGQMQATVKGSVTDSCDARIGSTNSVLHGQVLDKSTMDSRNGLLQVRAASSTEGRALKDLAVSAQLSGVLGPCAPPTSSLLEAQESGEMMEHVDEANFAMDGLRPGQPLRVCRASLISLLSIFGTRQRRRLLRTHGMVRPVLDAVLTVPTDDPATALGAAALLYVLAYDGQDEEFLESPACIHFLLKLLSPACSLPPDKKLSLLGSRLLALGSHCKPTKVEAHSTMLDKGGLVLVNKVKDLLSTMRGQNDGIFKVDCHDAPFAGGVSSSEWLVLLTLERACLSTLVLEDSAGSVRRVGGYFKERLRELGGLNAVCELAACCFTMLKKIKSKMDYQQQNELLNGSRGAGLLLRCLRVMENVTFLSENNQKFLLDMILPNSGVESPRTFLEMVIETINILSGFISSNSCWKCSTQGEQAYKSTKMQALNRLGKVSSQLGNDESTLSRQSLEGCKVKGSFEFDEDLDYSKDSDQGRKKQRSQVITKRESFNDTSAPKVDMQKSEGCENVVEDCLLSAVKVLMNLTNDNELGCRRVAIVGGLDAMASLIVRLFPSFRSFPSNVQGGGGETPQELKDQDLDLLVVVLGVLVNLVEKDTKNRGRLVSMNTEVFYNDSHTSVACKEYGIIKLLCSIFLSKEGAGRAIESSKGTPESEVDVESSLKQGQQEAEDMIVEAYSALLLAFLSKESSNVRSTIAQHLPDRNLNALVPVLERFLEFHLSLNMLSPETHDTVREVIESCK
ncbi:hypothetical protein GOP47_0015820 [Adiantum capillus-veneris]|uniref:Wings apart-like protein C-terminal domain-containing protein n=1 Tax=Adiantum capillus-veneris TaxID=13818 RepID=A0A9D4ZBZ6_ADICA|nr:hypothetical protein GOP47_0015820 [Adiantum capillus-veneris]